MPMNFMEHLNINPVLNLFPVQFLPLFAYPVQIY